MEIDNKNLEKAIIDWVTLNQRIYLTKYQFQIKTFPELQRKPGCLNDLADGWILTEIMNKMYSS